MKLSELYLDRYLYRDNDQDSETKDSTFASLDSSDNEAASIPSGGAAQDINTGNVEVDGSVIEPGTIPSTTLDVSNWGWTQSCTFISATLNTVTWGAGTFTSANGVSYAINAGTTGVMTGKTYIYLSLLDSETVYQHNTISSTAVGLGKVLVAVAENAADSATYMLSEATQIVGDNIIANTIDASKITTGQLIVGTNVGIGTAFPTASAGAVAYLDLIETAQLGTTVIVGGYIKTSLLTADNIITGTLNANLITITNLDTSELNNDEGWDVTADNSQSVAWLTDAGALALLNSVDLATAEVTNKVLDNIADGATYSKVLTTDISSGHIILSAATGDLDDIDNGTTYGRVNVTAISAGNIILSQTSGDLDDISDGSTYGKVNLTAISAGNILLSQTSGDLDDISNGSTYAKVASTSISAGKIILTSGTGVSGSLPVGNTDATVGAILGTNVSGGGSGTNQISNSGYVTTISGGIITTGTLNANNCTITNINASNINTGTLSAITVQTSSGNERIKLISDTIQFYSGGALKATLDGTSSGNGGIRSTGDFYVANNKSYWIADTTGGSTKYGGIGVSSSNHMIITSGTSNNIYIQNNAGSSLVSIFDGSQTIFYDGINCEGNFNVDDDYTARFEGIAVYFRNSTYTNARIQGSSTAMTYEAPSDHNFYVGGTASVDAVIDANIWTNGNLLAAGTKPFLIAHPDGSNRLLKYTAQESPEVILRHRGKGNTGTSGIIKIKLPEHFTLVTEPTGNVTVNLTSIGNHNIFLEKEPTNSEINVVSSDFNVSFHYEVMAVRKGYLNSLVEIDINDKNLPENDKIIVDAVNKRKKIADEYIEKLPKVTKK